MQVGVEACERIELREGKHERAGALEIAERESVVRREVLVAAQKKLIVVGGAGEVLRKAAYVSVHAGGGKGQIGVNQLRDGGIRDAIAGGLRGNQCDVR